MAVMPPDVVDATCDVCEVRRRCLRLPCETEAALVCEECVSGAFRTARYARRELRLLGVQLDGQPFVLDLDDLGASYWPGRSGQPLRVRPRIPGEPDLGGG